MAHTVQHGLWPYSMAYGPTAWYRVLSLMNSHIVMAYLAVAYIVMAYLAVAYIVMAYLAVAYIVMAYIAVAYLAGACIVMGTEC